jgi:hypothetical protein
MFMGDGPGWGTAGNDMINETEYGCVGLDIIPILDAAVNKYGFYTSWIAPCL